MKAIEQDKLVGIYRDMFPAAARLVNRLGGTRDETKDVFHDALLIYLERSASGKLAIKTSVEAYVLGITKILWLRTKENYTAPLPPEVEDLLAEEGTINEEEKNVLDYLVLAGEKCMQLLQAFYYGGSSLAEIAQQFGFSSIRSATVQKFKCVQKIRSEVKKMNVYAERTN
jgi:DNA-directed RNA polymerase specialized sigma24 family protein